MKPSDLIKLANQEVVEDGNFENLKNYFSEDYCIHLTNKKISGGHQLVKKSLQEMQKSFPVLEVSIDILVESESRVAWQRSYKAVHENKFKNFPASGKGLKWRDMVVSEFKNGLIAQEWLITDLAEQLLLARK